MTGMYTSKGIIGKVMQAFKKQIEKIQLDWIEEAALEEVNDAWEAFYDAGSKIILDEVKKVVKDMDQVVYVHVSGLNKKWRADDVNGLNSQRSSALYVTVPGDFVINIGFMDDVDGSKFAKKLGGWMNTGIQIGEDIYGKYDSKVGYNNVEIRDTEFIMIDGK
jgi:hypothetical protein